MREIEILSRQLERERKARKEAEAIAEVKSRVLYKANCELIDKEKKTNSILEATADGIIMLNKNNDIVIFNKAACRIFGYDGNELNGHNIKKLINPISNQELDDIIKLVRDQKKENILYEAQGLRKDSTYVPVEIVISRMQLTQESSIICAIRNIFVRKQQEQRTEVQHAITRIMAEHFSLNEIAEKVLKIMCETMQLDEGALWKVDKTSNILRCIHVWTIDDEGIKKFSEISKVTTFPPGIGLPGRIWTSKAPTWIKDVTVDPNFPRRKWAQEAGLHTAFALPILFEGEVLGIIEFFTRRTYFVDNDLMAMLHDISNQIGVVIEREQAQNRVNLLSRFAGMSEVASSVLHNVGNTLNSINTSVELLDEKINTSKMASLIELAHLIEQHKEDIVTFIANTPQGQQVPEFILLLAKGWIEERSYFLEEINELKKNVWHIKNIVMAQQSLSHPFGVTEETSLNELLDDALALNKDAYERGSIEIIRDFHSIKKVIIDKNKVFQILVNLIKNAIEALLESKNASKRLLLRVNKKDNAHFLIQVIDNGIGISEDTIIKIFSYGFSTKKTGHGFGLHSNALYADELGGQLFAESKGIGFGATFTLILPYQPVKQR